MAEEQTDQSQKTEEPTHKRLEDARKKGQVPSSREVNNWFMILAAAIAVMMLAPALMRDLKAAFIVFIEKPHAIAVDIETMRGVVGGLLYDVAGAIMPLILLLVMAALCSGLVQNGLIIAPDRLQPKLDKISLKSGFKRLFSSRSLAEFLKGLFKIAIVGSVATALMIPQFQGLEQLVQFETGQMLDFLHGLIVRLLIGVVSVITVIAVLDFLYQKFQHLKQMRMSRQEIKEELKQTEGDPIIKQRLRQIRQERARKRMMAAVPKATAVIANPTHYSVALKYIMDEMPAPVVVAKGVDHLALKIQEVAREHDIPIVRDPAVARALYAAVEIDEDIPPEHFKAVAEIISYVFRLKGERRRDRQDA